MAKTASARRFDKLVGDLLDLRAHQPQRFQLVWRIYFLGWAHEVQRRAFAQQQDSAREPIPAIFAVFNKAQRLASLIDASEEPSVAESLIHLRHLCSDAVARVTNPKLYRFRTDCTYRLRETFVRNRSRD